MNELLKHPWVRVLLIATTVAMCTLALRETASITLPVITALRDVLVPVAIGFTIAYVLTPVVDALARRGFNRTLAAGVLFGLFCLITVVGFSLVVPTVLRQTANLATRLFQGEKFTDLNGNGVWDEGEPYVDANGNGRYDAEGMLAAGLNWVEERQGQLRRIAKLELDRPALSFLSYYLDQTTAERATIDRALEMAREGRPPEQWPEPMRREPPADAPLAWNGAWPGASRAAVDDAYGKVPAEVRERWVRNLAVAGQSYAAKQLEMLTILRAIRHGQSLPEGSPLAAREHQLREALQAPLSDEAQKAAKAFSARLADDGNAGQPAAKELLAELRGDDAGNQWLIPVVQSLEHAVNAEVDALPTRLGGWAKSSLSSFDLVLAIGLDVLLVPIYAFFLILAMPAIRSGVRAYLPMWHRDQTLRIVRDIERVVAAFFRGRLIVCAICGLFTYLGFISIGMFGTGVPYAALFGLLIGLATAVPLAGLLFLVPAVIMTLLDGGTSVTACLVIGVYLVVQVLETVVLTPTIMGHEVELHPVTLIVALLLCGKLLGILGLILAVPIAATCRILAREFMWPRLKEWATASTPRDETVP